MLSAFIGRSNPFVVSDSFLESSKPFELQAWEIANISDLVGLFTLSNDILFCHKYHLDVIKQLYHVYQQNDCLE